MIGLWWVCVRAWEYIRRGEGGEEWGGKKDTGYLYKAFMVAALLCFFLHVQGSKRSK